MGHALRNRILAFVDAVEGDTLSIPEVVRAFPAVDTDTMVAALLNLTTDGTIQVRGEKITVRHAHL